MSASFWTFSQKIGTPYFPISSTLRHLLFNPPLLTVDSCLGQDDYVSLLPRLKATPTRCSIVDYFSTNFALTDVEPQWVLATSSRTPTRRLLVPVRATAPVPSTCDPPLHQSLHGHAPLLLEIEKFAGVVRS